MSRTGSYDTEKAKIDSLARENNALTGQIEELRHTNLLLSTLLRISELTHNFGLDINSLYKQIHDLLGTVLNTSNFYITRLNTHEQILHFVYYEDDT
jgi:hypothetical protein